MATGVFSVGIAVLDYVYGLDAIPVRPQKYRSRELTIVGGGLAANASVAVARLGGRSWLATRLGDDPTGGEIVAGLERDGVDMRFARRFPGRRSPVSAILVDRAGERMVISYSDPEMPTDPAWLPARLPEGVGAVLGDTRWDTGSAAAFRLARAAGVPAVLDEDRAPAGPAVIELASHIAFSHQGVAELTGHDDPADALRALAGRTAAWAAVTLGAGGVIYLDGDEARHVPAFAVEAVDTLAAGDVWHGAFALALAEGRTDHAAVVFASAAAALKCTRFGGRAGTPSRAELDAFLRERSHG